MFVAGKGSKESLPPNQPPWYMELLSGDTCLVHRAALTTCVESVEPFLSLMHLHTFLWRRCKPKRLFNPPSQFSRGSVLCALCVYNTVGSGLLPFLSCFSLRLVHYLCRDGASEISRDPRTKRLQTRLAWHSKNTNNTFWKHIYIGLLVPTCLQFATRESATRDFTIFAVIIFLFSKSAISLPEQVSALIFSPNVSAIDGGVHGHRAIVFLLPYIPTVDRGALPRQTLNDAIYMRYTHREGAI